MHRIKVNGSEQVDQGLQHGQALCLVGLHAAACSCMQPKAAQGLMMLQTLILLFTATHLDPVQSILLSCHVCISTV